MEETEKTWGDIEENLGKARILDKNQENLRKTEEERNKGQDLRLLTP